MPQATPRRSLATDFDVYDQGFWCWADDGDSDSTSVSSDESRVEWAKNEQSCWCSIPTLARLHSGDYSWTFEIESPPDRQILVGFMLLYDLGPDWGFYGYLGSGGFAWAYDPSSGDVVNSEVSIAGGLPTLPRGIGKVDVTVHLPRESTGYGTFTVAGVDAPRVSLPVGAVIVPGATLSCVGQSVRIGNLSKAYLFR